MNSSPSILFVVPGDLSAPTGVNQVVINLAREAARQQRLRPIIFCRDDQQDAFSESEFEGIKLVTGRLRSPLSGDRPTRNLAVFTHKLRDELRIWREFLAKQHIQVVNAHQPGLECSVLSLLRMRRAGFRLVFSLHGPDEAALARLGVAVRPFARWMLNKADLVTCCSDDLTRQAQASLKLGEQQVVTIHNGVNVEELDRAKNSDYRPPIGGFDSYLLNVATYGPRKGQDILLHAYTKLLGEGLKSALVLAGRSTPHLPELQSLARQLKLQDHVFFLPDLPHAQTLGAIRNARALVQPSRDEAFGLPLLEAAYLATPVVACRVGGVPEVLGGYYPYLAKPDDPAALASAIDDALFNPTECRQQLKLMRRRVTTRFTWGMAARAYAAAWQPESTQ